MECTVLHTTRRDTGTDVAGRILHPGTGAAPGASTVAPAEPVTPAARRGVTTAETPTGPAAVTATGARTATNTGSADVPAAAPGEATGATQGADSGSTGRFGARGVRRAPRGRDADGMAVASFVLGLIGLLVANIFLGPVAVVLALVALTRGTTRRGRAFLGLALGVADLVVLAALVAGDHTLSWSIAG